MHYTNARYLLTYRLDWSGRTPLPLREHNEHVVEACSDGRCDAVLMWWELGMRDDGLLTLSTAPYWAHPTPTDMQVIIVVINK